MGKWCDYQGWEIHLENPFYLLYLFIPLNIYIISLPPFSLQSLQKNRSKSVSFSTVSTCAMFEFPIILGYVCKSWLNVGYLNRAITTVLLPLLRKCSQLPRIRSYSSSSSSSLYLFPFFGPLPSSPLLSQVHFVSPSLNSACFSKPHMWLKQPLFLLNKLPPLHTGYNLL